jgi:four helix bundle protein
VKANQLEDSLIQFAMNDSILCKQSDHSFASEHLNKQLIRSATSAALNYGEARGAESTRDFIHEMKVSLKKLRGSYVNLKIQSGTDTISNYELIKSILKENDELISIFVSSIKTASNSFK